MSPQLSSRCALALLAAIVLASLVGLLALGPLQDGDSAHRLTDARSVAGLPNGWSVLLQLPLLAVAAAGALSARAAGADPPLQRAWRLFFALVGVAALASIADHLAPSATGYVLSKLPTASASALLSLIFLAERLGLGWLRPAALVLALTSGPLGGALYFGAEALHGQADGRLLLWLQILPLLLVPLGVWSLPSRGLDGLAWTVALLAFAFAELLDWADTALWQASGGAISGHALHHLPLAACLGWLAWGVARQRNAAGVSAAPVPAAALPPVSQAATSLTTFG